MEKIRFQPGQLLEINTDDGGQFNTFESKLLSIDRDLLEISAPINNGVFAPLNTGFNLSLKTITNTGLIEFDSTIMRKNIERQSFFVSLPPNILNYLEQDKNLPSKKSTTCRFITISSGKGGTGKTCFAINFAISLSKRGKRVALIDADLGMANIDVLTKVTPIYTLTDVIKGYKTLDEIITDGPEGIKLVPGGTGLFELANLNAFQLDRILSGFEHLESNFDYVLIDTSAGISKNINEFVISSHETIIVTTPEPHAISDAFSILKVFISKHHNLNVKLVVNRCETPQEGEFVIKRISGVIGNFPNCKFSPLGIIPESRYVSKSVKEQNPFMISYPGSDAASAIESITDVELGEMPKTRITETFSDNNESFDSNPRINELKNILSPTPAAESESPSFVKSFRKLFGK